MTTPPAAPAAAPRRALPAGLRIALASLVTFLVATAVAGAFLASSLRALAERTLDARIRTELDLLGPVALDALAREDLAALRAAVAAVGERAPVRITVLRPDGTVVAESSRPLPLANHADRPEVIAALERGTASATRTSTTLGEPTSYVARRLDLPDGRTAGVLRLAQPAAAPDLEGAVARVLGLAVLLGLPVAAAVGWLAARRIARPLEEMTEAASRMAAGDFARLPRAERDDEVGRLAESLRHMGRRLSETLERTEADRAELAAILGSMLEGVVALDRDERLLHLNRSAAECLGLSASPAAGTPLREVVRVPELFAQLRAALAGERPVERDVQLPGRAGRVLAISAAPIVAPAGGLRGAVAVLRDVTVIRKLERMRLDFVANVSHELRTPLAAMSAALESLESLGDEDPEARRGLVEMGRRHARRLTAIVEDLLALSEIESEGDRLERESVPVGRSLRSAAAAVTASGLPPDVTLELPPKDAADVLVLGNEGRLEQVWVNLLSNALKYNRPGGRVTVTVTSDPADRTACVAVSDTGRGIPQDALPRIFERFYRVDKGRSRDQGGTGLGLAIVKHIVRAHRGRVEVESEPGKGSVFRVWLPVP